MISLFLRGAIRLYQLTLAYFFVGACRYEPSCSRYAIEAVEHHGARRGVARAVHRFCRCGPWGKGGYDPVPTPQATPQATASRAPLSCHLAERI